MRVIWDKAFIEDELSDAEDLKKIWICGSPQLQETFDRAFYDMKKENPARFKEGVIH